MNDVLFRLYWTDSPKVKWVIKPRKTDIEYGVVKWGEVNKLVKLVSSSKFEIKKVKRLDTQKGVYPLLKSNLQKHIRRGNVDDAVKTAQVMWDLDPFTLIWRLFVIAVEDSEIFEEFGVLMWFCAALTKGICLLVEHRDYVLNVVYEIAGNKTCHLLKLTDNYLGQTLFQENSESDQRKILLNSILFRISYGGTQSDIDLLLRSILYYANEKIVIPRLEKRIKFSLEPKQDCLVIPPKLKILQASADFHVQPKILTSLVSIANSKGKNYTEDDVKKAIWAMSSRRNFRLAYPPSEKLVLKLFESIRENFELLANKYINETMAALKGD